MTASGHLVVIDAQHVFADPDSPWVAPRFAEALGPMRTLVEAYDGRASFTRWVSPARPQGAWRAYFDAWPFALRPADDPLWDLVPAFAGRPTLDHPTFGKWDAQLAGLVGDELVVAGVATDCCVVSTVLAAADAGVHVRVAADACAGGDDAGHATALDLMARYAPLVEVVTAADVLRD